MEGSDFDGSYSDFDEDENVYFLQVRRRRKMTRMRNEWTAKVRFFIYFRVRNFRNLKGELT